MKKLISFCLLLAITASLVGTAFAAGNSLKLSAQTSEAAVTVTVSAEQESVAGRIVVSFDPAVLTLDAVEPVENLEISDRKLENGRLTLGYAAGETVRGELLHLTFSYGTTDAKTTELNAEATFYPASGASWQENARTTVQLAGGHEENCPSKAYPDLDTAAWYHAYTDYVIDHQMMIGYENGSFGPNRAVTRAMAVTVLYRLAGSPAVETPDTFTDVREGLWYSNAVAWAQTNGIAKGLSETVFAPNQPVTREQTAAFLYRYVKDYAHQTPAPGADLSGYQDARQISNYAKEAMAWAHAVGLMDGFGNGYLGPKHQTTRVQLAKLLTILHRDLSA